ncbi:hypothetical protein [Parafilimonas sp.]|uniref:hypothetical protein n=1 Tax=Parafilimonas sp. TaxID=1969739 RepID=UPI0039E2E2ED
MKRKLFILFFIGAVYQHGLCQRRHNGPQPADQRAAITVLDLRYLLGSSYKNADSIKVIWDAAHAIATLQGIVNRNSPDFYIKYIVTDGRSIDDYWLDKYRQPGKWLSARPVVQLNNIDEAFVCYKKRVKGLVVYDPAVAATSNIASSIAGIEDLIAVRYDTSPTSIYTKLISMGFAVKQWLVNKDGSSLFTGSGIIPGTGLPSTGSAKNDAYRWFIRQYLKTGKCNTAYAAYYIDQYWMQKPGSAPANHHTLTNHDFFVSKKGFFFDLSPWDDEPATDDPGQAAGTDYATLKLLLQYAYAQNGGQAMLHIGGFPSWAFKYTCHAGGKHQDVETEWQYTRLISAYNAFQDADAIGYGAMANASFWAHFPLKSSYPQNRTTIEALKKQGLLAANGKFKTGNKNFVVFYAGDYDAASWVYQKIPFIWDDSSRGKVPLMWSVSPVLERRAPMALDYMRETATANDFFAAADNGAGYLNPGMLQAPRDISGLPDGAEAWEAHNNLFINDGI